jgi:uncharacterized membrane protein YfcA
LNLGLTLSPAVAAATASSIFILATVAVTGLYYHSDGIDWALAAVVALPAVVGTHLGIHIAAGLSVRFFEVVLGAALFLASLGIVYQQRRSAGTSIADGWSDGTVRGLIAAGSGIVGIVAGITGLGGPALIIPLMIVLGVSPIVAIGASMAGGVLITANTTLGHVANGTPPAPLLFLLIGVPFVVSQVLGWRYVHVVSERMVSYTIAGIAAAGSVVIVA